MAKTFEEMAAELPEEMVTKITERMLKFAKLELAKSMMKMATEIDNMKAPHMGDKAVKKIVIEANNLIQRFIVISCFARNDLALLEQYYEAMKRDAYKGFHRLADAAEDSEQVFEDIKREYYEKTDGN